LKNSILASPCKLGFTKVYWLKFHRKQNRIQIHLDSESMAGPTGIEPATYGLRVRRSSLAELRARMILLLKKFSLRNIELAVSIKL
jgi:hypothetical protein